MQEQPQQKYEGAERRHAQQQYDGDERRMAPVFEEPAPDQERVAQADAPGEEEQEQLEEQDVRQRDDTH